MHLQQPIAAAAAAGPIAFHPHAFRAGTSLPLAGPCLPAVILQLSTDPLPPLSEAEAVRGWAQGWRLPCLVGKAPKL